ncbi:MAG: hypothetical protein ABIN45_03265 [Gammaproteobacteria bacterium]
MIGKKNIVFGFFYLVLTAALGPYMVVTFVGDVGKAEAVKQEKLGALQQSAENQFEMNLAPMSADEIAKQTANGLLALSARLNSYAPIQAIKGGPHAHGNLEALLNITVGVVLAFLTVSTLFKQVISWVFILGALLHSGLLYLAVLGLPWAGAALGSPFGIIGPALILLGLLLMGIASLMGFQSKPAG